MAENNYLDDDNAEERDGDEPQQAGGKKKLLMMAALGVGLVAVSVGGTLLAVKLLTPEPPQAEVAASELASDQLPSMAEASAEMANGEEASASEETSEAEAKAAKSPAIYYPIKPPIIVNFDARGRQRFLQAELALMTREEDVVSALELHMPMIRNSLILLMGSHLYEELQTAEGKELLRQQCLQELRRLMEKEIGKPGVEQVLFTNFVMQ